MLAHAVVNAALAAASGRDAASAAAGAAVGELVGKIAVDKLAGKIAVDGFGKQVSELSEEENRRYLRWRHWLLVWLAGLSETAARMR